MRSISIVDIRTRYARRHRLSASRRRDMNVGKRQPFALLIGIVVPLSLGLAPGFVSSPSVSFDPGIGKVPQGTQSDQTFRDSFGANTVTNVFVTSQQVSCYRPEVPFAFSNV